MENQLNTNWIFYPTETINYPKETVIYPKETVTYPKKTETVTGQYQWDQANQWNSTPLKNKIIKKTTKTIEKYDEKGKFLSKKVITKEIEIDEVPIWNYSTNVGIISTGSYKF